MGRVRVWLAWASLAAAIAGCNDPLPATDGGPGTDGSVPIDGSPDGGGDPCRGLTLCTTAGTACDGDSLVTCAANADGCMVETTEDCGLGGEICDDASGTAACVDPCSLIPEADRCTTDGARACTGETLEICAMDADGCLVLERTDCAASPGGVCDDSGSMPVCALPPDPCASIAAADRCTSEGATSCDGASLVECQADAFGCLVNVRTDCASRAGGSCTAGTGSAYECGGFTGDPCAGVTPCATAGTTCDGPALVTCEADAFGCMVETRTDCSATMFGFCDAAGAPAACSTAATDPCMGLTECDPAAARACTDRSTLTTCAANAFGCYVAADTNCAATSEVCDASGGTPVCVDPCSLVHTCPSATWCDGSDSVTCAADADGCLVESARTTCADPQVCGATSGTCVDACPEAATRVIDCASGTVSGDTAMGTTANGGDYGDCYDGTGYAGAEQYWRFRHAGTDPVWVTVTSTRGTGTEDYDLFVLGGGTSCTDATPVCLDSSRGVGSTETVAFPADPDAVAYVVYDLYSSTETTTYTLAVVCEPFVCGDGQIVGSETCDDGNATDGDGCSASCAIETGSVCYGEPSTCGAALTCGNGVRETGEGCDDGDTTAGDGCSATCTVEVGYQCSSATPNVCTLLCGNGTVNTSAGETCDDGDRDPGDGCSAACTIESGYNCSGAPSVCVAQAANATCATATAITATTTLTGEDTRRGGASTFTGTGCAAGSSTTALYYELTVPAFTRVTVSALATTSFDVVIESRDACDDAGCTAYADAYASSTTSSEVLSLTNATASPVTRVVAISGWSGAGNVFDVSFTYDVVACGNGVVDVGEGCDDGGTTDGDGCSGTCTVESGYRCAGAPSACTLMAANGTCAGATAVTFPQTITGENIAAGGPRPTGTGCGTSSGDDALYYSMTIPAGATAQVQVTETGAAWDSVILSQSACGDTTCASRVDTTSATETMTITNSSSSPMPRVIAVHNYDTTLGTFDVSFSILRTCGNGTIEAGETCDDGDLTAGDGCSATCAVEPNYVCTGAPSSCVRPTYAMSAIPLACVDTSTGTALTLSGDDSSSSNAALPFEFPFYAAPQARWSVSTNALLQLFTSTTSTASTAWTNAAIPTSDTPNGFIAPFWDDLAITSGTGSVRTITTGAAGSRVFTIEWQNALVRSVAGSSITFQVQLHEATGAIEMHYCGIAAGTGGDTTGASASIGVESSTGTEGTQFSYNTSSVTWGTTALRFTPGVL